MSLLPKNKTAKVAFFKSKVTPWTDNATAIGVSTTAVSAMSTLITAAEAKLADQLAATEAAKAAVAAANLAVDAVVVAGMDLVKDIRAKAATAGDVVYTLAEIPAPATPTPVGDLAKPTDFVVTLEETGELNLAFKAAQPKSASGVTYQIWRKIDNTAPFVCVGGCGSEKKFFDATVPAGSRSVTYKIQAWRSTSKSPWAQFVVNFGVEMGATTIASIVETPAAKIAA
jgi:hypothetical protein